MAEPLWVIIPVKTLEAAKQRLAGVLTPQERQRLFKALLQDTLSALRGQPAVTGTLVVSDDPRVQRLASDCDLLWQSERELQAKGLNGVLQAAVTQLAMRGVNRVLILHGDLPLLQKADLDALIEAGQGQSEKGSSFTPLVIAPDRHGSGTNALLFDPGLALQLSYGVDSFHYHCAQAQSLGVPLSCVSRPALARDIDLPEDLHFLAELDSATGAIHTRAYLQRSGIAKRLCRAANDHKLMRSNSALSDTVG